MAAPIGVGDWVEFIGSSLPPPPSRDGVGPVLGRIYCVRQLRPRVRCTDGVVRPGLRVFGVRQFVKTTGKECSYPLIHFRPIYRPRAEIIEALKQPAPSEMEPA